MVSVEAGFMSPSPSSLLCVEWVWTARGWERPGHGTTDQRQLTYWQGEARMLIYQGQAGWSIPAQRRALALDHSSLVELTMATSQSAPLKSGWSCSHERVDKKRSHILNPTSSGEASTAGPANSETESNRYRGGLNIKTPR